MQTFHGCENTLLFLQGNRTPPYTPIATVARYEFLEMMSGWEHSFVGSISAKEIELDGMLGVVRETGATRGRKRRGS